MVIYKESEVMGHAKTLTRSKMGKTTAFRKEMNQPLQRYEKSIFLGIEKEAFLRMHPILLSAWWELAKADCANRCLDALQFVTRVE